MEKFLLENQVFVGVLAILVFGAGFAFFALGGGELLKDLGDDDG